jgi:hypothetical protein
VPLICLSDEEDKKQFATSYLFIIIKTTTIWNEME